MANRCVGNARFSADSAAAAWRRAAWRWQSIAQQRHGTDQQRVGWAPTGNAVATLGGAKPGHSCAKRRHSDEAQRLGTALSAMLGSGYAQRRKAKEQLGKSTLWQCKARRGMGRA